MSRITISDLAAEKIKDDPKFRQSKENDSERTAPLLYYYQRSFSTLNDGTTIEHGDGFILTYVNPETIKEAADIIYKTVAIGDGASVTIGGAKSVISNDFSIGWSNAKFTFEPQMSS